MEQFRQKNTKTYRRILFACAVTGVVSKPPTIIRKMAEARELLKDTQAGVAFNNPPKEWGHYRAGMGTY